jgi:hypothetical protein
MEQRAQGKGSGAPAGAVESKLFLTRRDAAALSGPGVSHLGAAIKSGDLEAYNLPHIRGKRIAR